MKKLLLIFALIACNQLLIAQFPSAYYRMDGNANDATGYANHGTVTGATLTIDRFGNADRAYSFAGGTDKIEVPDAPIFNIGDYLSASAWVYVSSTPPAAGGGTAYGIISKNEGPGNNMKKWLFGLQNGKLAFHHNGPGLGSGEWVYSDNFTLNPNQWYHVAMIKAVQEVTFFVNGVPTGTQMLPTAMVNAAANLQIGNSENTLQFQGKLDEVNLYNYILTPKQVSAQYYDQALVASFPFNGNADDQSGNDNHGTVIGSILTSDRFGNTDAAYDFSVTDKIDVPNSPNFQIGTNDYTLSYWIKTTTADAVIMGKEPHTALGMMQYIYNDGTVEGRSEYPNGIFSSDIAINNNVWHQIVFVRKGTTSKIFIDGRLSNTAILPLSDISNAENFSIGHNGPDPFVGQLDDIKIHNVAVDDKTIFDNYIKDQTLPGSGNALNCDSGSLNISNSKSTEITEQITVEAWVKPTLFSNPVNQILQKGGGVAATGNPTPDHNGYELRLDQINGLEYINLIIGDATSVDYLTAPISNSDLNKWMHITGVYSSLNGYLKLYKNGILLAEKNTNQTISYLSSSPMQIGLRNDNLHKFEGDIDEVKVWNTALSETEIRDWMCKKITSTHPKYDKLVAYFNFDENVQSIPQARKLSVLNPTVRGFGGHFGELINNAVLQTSGAALGDESIYSYNNVVVMAHDKNSKKASALLNPITIYHTTGENITVTSITGNPEGIQVYHVNEAPNTSTGLNQTDPFPHYFGVFQVGGIAPEYTATYNYFGQNVPTAESNLRLYSRTNNSTTNWTEYPSLPNTSNKTIELTGQNTEYILAGGLTTLPLNLLSFSGKNENETNILTWQTANEVALSHFEIERSPLAPDGGTGNGKFVKIGQVNANGGPSEKVGYEYADQIFNSSWNTPPSGVGGLFYRLKMIDLDGKYKYSKIIYLENKLQSEPKIYPNPTSDYFSISGNQTFEKLQIVDASGRIVKEFLPQSDNKYSLNSLANGVYLARSIGGNMLINSKIIVK